MHFSRFLVVCWIGAAACLSVQAGELEDREAIVEQLHETFAKGDFAALERGYANAVKKATRLPDGLPLSALYLHFNVNTPKYGFAAPAPDAQGRVTPIPGEWNALEPKFERWKAAFPESALAATAHARMLIGKGWEVRGGGFANTVNPENMRAFRGLVDRAYKVLMERKAVGAKDPGWYATLFEIARYQGWSPERYAELLKDAIAAFPDNEEIYFAAGETLQPKWGGSAKAFAALAEQATLATQARSGQALYARLYWKQYRDYREMAEAGMDWKRFSAGFEDIVKRYPSPLNLASYGRFACQAGDKELAKRLLARIGEAPEKRAWDGRRGFMRCRNWAADPAPVLQ